MSIASYCELVPSAALAPWVVCYWSRASFGPQDKPVVRRILPDGCADVIFSLGGEAIAVGAMTTPLVLRDIASPDYLGVRFRPGRALIGIPLEVLTDRRLPLGDLWGRSAGDLAERLALAPDTLSRIALLEAELTRRIAATDRRVDAAVERIVATGGRVPINGIASAVGVSRQHLARQFLRHVGITPKTFARVVRFERVLRAVARGRRDWARLAADCGYFDQAHLIGDFRELAGAPPVPFFQSPDAQLL